MERALVREAIGIAICVLLIAVVVLEINRTRIDAACNTPPAIPEPTR